MSYFTRPTAGFTLMCCAADRQIGEISGERAGGGRGRNLIGARYRHSQKFVVDDLRTSARNDVFAPTGPIEDRGAGRFTARR